MVLDRVGQLVRYWAMAHPQDFREVISLWPSVQALADEIDEKTFTVEKWRTRNRIPSWAWKRILTKAQKRRLPVTADLLVDFADGAYD